jgi:hypothetical protein
MSRFVIAVAGMLIGGAVGWWIPAWIYPWDTIIITSAGPTAVERIFQFFGLCLGGPLGFLTGSWLALRCLPQEPPVQTPPLPPVDPRKVEDNLD